MARPDSNTAFDTDDFFRQLVDRVTDHAVYLFDLSGVIRTWNAGAEALFGYTADEAIGLHASVVYTREDRLSGRPLAALKAAEPDGRSIEDGICVRRDQSRFAARRIIYPLRRDDRPVGHAMLVRDISTELAAVETLVENDRQQRQAIDAITDCAVAKLDREGCVASWSSGAQRLFGYRADEIIGQPMAILLPGPEQQNHRSLSLLAAAAASGRQEVEVDLLRKDGSAFAAHVAVEAIHDAAGVFGGGILIVRDVTERLQAAQAFAASENRFHLLIESVTDHAIFTLDASGIVTSWNVGAERIHGWSEAEILGEHAAIFYPEHDRKVGLPFQALETARREGRFEAEGYRVRKDGSRFAADVVLYAVTDAKGELSGFTKITRDISERKQREIAEAANAAKSRFLAQMSHEFRTPLNAIIGFSEIIKTELLGEISNRKYVTYGSDIHYSGQHLLSLVNDLLDLTRIEVGKLEPMRRSFDIKPVAERAIRLFDGVTSNRRIKVDLSLAGELSDFIADERMVRQCIVNLVDNAIKYSGSGGTIRVAIGRLDDRLSIRVIDQGRGMAQAEIPRALEPFGRVGDVMTTPIEGIGLGLPLVKSYCELHGGQLAIKSAPGAGTEIVLTFPYSGRGGKRSAA